MEREQLIKALKIAVTCLIVFSFLWFLLIYPLGSFNKNENKMESAAKRYFELNPAKLPREGKIATVELAKLYSKNYLDALYIPYTKKMCSVEDSWVKVKKEKGDYKYYTYLKCGILSSNVDHNGPNIVLNGDETIKLDLGSDYKELGVKSVVDNTDGKIDVKKVQINNSAVNTSKVGTYKVKYTVSDSFKNQTVKVRTVVVRKTLASTVKKATNNTGIYQGEVDNNYIRFANTLFRIVKLNKEGTITLVSDNSLAFVDYNNLDNWLNKYYYDLLPSSSKKYLADGNWCNQEVKDVKNYRECQDSTENKISVLSIADYNNSISGSKSYLSNYNSSWTSNTKDSNAAYAVSTVYKPGDVKANNKNDNLGVRVAVTIKKGTSLTGGDGTETNPYTLGDVKRGKSSAKLNTRFAGEYITYGGMIYRIINTSEDGPTKVLGEFEVVDEESNPIEISYEKEPYIYNPRQSGNIGYKINNELKAYFKTDYFVNHEIEVPIYNDKAIYKKEDSTKKYKVKFSAPNMYEIYSFPDNRSGVTGYWMINSSQNKDYQYYTNPSGFLKNGKTESSAVTGVRIVGYLDPKCSILSGDGTYGDPYKIAK